MTHEFADDLVASLLADTSPYVSCDECFARIDAYIEKRVADPSYDDAGMAAHLAGCGACREEGATLAELLGPAPA